MKKVKTLKVDAGKGVFKLFFFLISLSVDFKIISYSSCMLLSGFL